MKKAGLNRDSLFNEANQDKLAHTLLMSRQSVRDFLNGKSQDVLRAVRDISRTWASVANPDTGRSYYEGVGRNRASISVDKMKGALISERRRNAERVATHPQQVTGNTVNNNITINAKDADAGSIKVAVVDGLGFAGFSGAGYQPYTVA